MATKNEQGEWKNGRGNYIPVSKVRPIDREKDRTVEAIFHEIKMLEDEMQRKKDLIMDRIEDYKAQAEEEFDAEFSESGAITLTNYSADKQIEIKINNLVKLDEKADLAKEKFKKVARRWSHGADEEDNLIALIESVFRLDKSGNYDRSRFADLRRMNISDPEWKSALDLLKEAEYGAGSREYIMIRERKKPGKKFQSKSLNFSTI